ncbi:MFS transporter [Candidatus Enterococcus ferrettii]|uniref:Major facilitator superfamily (MFS) profile domain-containing protein n=1 Tax=Candidatus Enterococcus ferrettii TaxID=2815324 RepID=A0ABV0EPG0_9ENTE|nr:MFS transporter [Enterococcus sp. 665A]MBO1343129.1 MFS transporter [Enterococcus sp. 665A]
MNKKSFPLIGLLSAALVIASAPAISANIPAISAAFPHISATNISLFTTIPSLFLILGVFLTTSVEQKIGKKKTILTGLLMVGVFGSLPFWYSQSFWVLFASRCLLGIGIGLFNRLVIQMIGLLYQREPVKKARALGLESAFEGLGGILMTITVGQLVKISWQWSFIVYGLAFLGFLLIFLFVPDKEEPTQSNQTGSLTKVPQETKKGMVKLALLLFLIVTFFIVYNLQITPLLIEQGIGDATQGSNMIAAISIGAFTAGNLFGKTYSWLKNYIVPIAAATAGCCIFITTISPAVWVSLICSAGLGFSFRNIMPYFNHLYTSGNEASSKFGTTVVLIAYNLGSTLSPYVIKIFESLSIDSQPSILLTFAAAGFIGIGLITLVFNRKLFGSFNA